MVFSADELRHLVVRETLQELGEWTPAAENLLLGTAAQESALGLKLKEGRMAGIYHISPAAHRAVWDRYLIHYPDLASIVRGMAGQRSFIRDPHGELISNLKYATAIAWFTYKRTGRQLPEDSSVENLAKYWHRHFHAKATGTIEDFIRNFRNMVSPTSSVAA
ncbi:MAG: hypothetical protein DRR42_04565 [Gammaproteobacteria bacterium]|nr:MAG: hypothetical protein DRR42_04565 [Gammaproteobacteria bacterium]